MTHIADDRDVDIDVDVVDIDNIPGEEVDLLADLEIMGDAPNKKALQDAFDIDPEEAAEIVNVTQATREGLSPADRRQMMADINEVRRDDTLNDTARKESIAQIYRNYDLEVPEIYQSKTDGPAL